MKIENARKISRMLLGLSLLIGGWWGFSAGQAENMKYAKRFGMTIEQFKHDEAYGRNAFCYTATGILYGFVIGFLGGKAICRISKNRSRKAPERNS